MMTLDREKIDTVCADLDALAKAFGWLDWRAQIPDSYDEAELPPGLIRYDGTYGVGAVVMKVVVMSRIHATPGNVYDRSYVVGPPRYGKTYADSDDPTFRSALSAATTAINAWLDDHGGVICLLSELVVGGPFDVGE